MSTAGAESPAGDAAGAAGARTVDVLVGRVGKAHGLRGDVVVDVRTDEPARRFAAGTRFATPLGELTVASTHWHGSRLLVRFDEIDDRDAASELRGAELRTDVPADERPEDPEEFYDHQLVGLCVVDAAGRQVGEVTDVLHLPAQDVLAVARVDGSDTLLPFVHELVPDVDLVRGRIELSHQADWLSSSVPELR
jgi:16S rRNA processing protein RimM